MTVLPFLSQEILSPRIMLYFSLHELLLLTDINYCANATCKNGASCVDRLNNYTCSCVPGFVGDHCETGMH